MMQSNEESVGLRRARLATVAAAVVLAAALAVYSVWASTAGGVEAADPVEVLTTPEGTTIEMYTNQIDAQTVYNLLKRNGLNAETGKTLTLVQVWDSGGASSMLSFTYVDGKWVPRASMRLSAANLAIYPNASVGHEFGHVFAHHYLWTVWDGSWDAYLEARGLLGDPRLGSAYEWSDTEIFAEDHRQLLASLEAWDEVPSQLNRDIPLASEVPGLGDFLCTTFQAKTSNDWFRCSGSPAPGPTPSPAATATPGATPQPTPTPTFAPTPGQEPTPTPTSGLRLRVTPAPTLTPTAPATPTPTSMPVPTETPQSTRTATPTTQPTPAPTSTPQPTPDGSPVVIAIPSGWHDFVAPVGGHASPSVYVRDGGKPWSTSHVVQGHTYWAKGPAEITISPDQ